MYLSFAVNYRIFLLDFDQIAPISTSEFLSLSYNKTTFNNYKNYLRNTNNFSNWYEQQKLLNTNYNFYLPELAEYIKEIGFIKNNNTTFYYLKTEEARNVSSLLDHIKDITYTSKNKKYHKIHLDSLFQLLAGKLFTKNQPKLFIKLQEYQVLLLDRLRLKAEQLL